MVGANPIHELFPAITDDGRTAFAVIEMPMEIHRHLDKASLGFLETGIGDAIPCQPDTGWVEWDMWLGPAPMHSFSRECLPFVWRAWYDFGCGALGDMGEYGFDTISRAIGLQPAERIEASSTNLFPDCYPVASAVHVRFAKTESRPELELSWYDGGIEPRRPQELAGDAKMETGGEGVIYTSNDGKVMTAYMGENPRVMAKDGKMTMPFGKPIAKTAPFQVARPELGGSASGVDAAHYLEWIRACQGGPPARADDCCEAPIVETLLLGCIAVRTQGRLIWDSSKFELTGGSERATALLKPPFRAPWGN